ncbi:MAG: hypothetical protein M3401_01380 [Actinomycetota bacterium]|nr:hypothetical protein [Actinomycetota bacterium]
MTPPLAHAGHWLVNLLYLLPLVLVFLALGFQALRDRRRATGARREQTDDPPRV